MPGFDNSVMYADNVDFSGTSPVTGKVTTNGQVLIGSTAAPNIRVGTLASANSSITYTTGAGTLDLSIGNTYLAEVSVTLTANQVKALNATPVTLVAAPGPGNFLELVSNTLIYDFNTTPYDVSAGGTMNINYTDGSGTNINSFSANGFLDQGSDQIQSGPNGTIVSNSAANIVNAPIVIVKGGAGEYTLGNSPVTIRTFYRIHPTGL